MDPLEISFVSATQFVSFTLCKSLYLTILYEAIWPPIVAGAHDGFGCNNFNDFWKTVCNGLAVFETRERFALHMLGRRRKTV